MRPERDKDARRKPILARGADGSLKSADDTDIGDVWAQQERIRLAEQIEEDQAKKERKHKQRNLFKRRPKEIKKAPPTQSSAVTSTGGQPGGEISRQARDDKHGIGQEDKTAVADNKTIEININMPSMDWARRGLARLKRLPGAILSRFKRLKRSMSVTAASILGILLILVAYNVIFRHHSSDGSSSDSGKSAGADVSLKATPTFNTILPTGKSATQLGGWARVSPKNSAPTYAYADNIKGAKIIVSEQQLPQSFKADPAGSVANLAEQFSATQKIHTGDGTVYLGNSTSGVQSLVFTKDDLLILIKSDRQLSDDDWIEYIDSLE